MTVNDITPTEGVCHPAYHQHMGLCYRQGLREGYVKGVEDAKNDSHYGLYNRIKTALQRLSTVSVDSD